MRRKCDVDDQALSFAWPLHLGYSALMAFIYKIAPRALWSQAEAAGVFAGAPIDVADGYIHFSTAAQARETAAKHFAGKTDLVLAAVDADALGDKLRWEASRGGQLFPHLYAPLNLSAVVWVKDLPLGDDGIHQFPELAA
jgi:uncharacterized protein (DUF952 family)